MRLKKKKDVSQEFLYWLHIKMKIFLIVLIKEDVIEINFTVIFDFWMWLLENLAFILTGHYSTRWHNGSFVKSRYGFLR